jgi:DNA-binding MarR family transcriptional regulator
MQAEARRFRELLLGVGRCRSLRDPIAGACDAMRLTAAQIHVLLWLGHDGTLAMGELARRIGTTDRTVTGVVDRLEREGHLRRERDAADRRVVRVRLTRKGADAYGRVDGRVNGKVAELIARLDAADRHALFRILETLHDRLLAEHAEGAAPPRGAGRGHLTPRTPNLPEDP